MSHTHLYILGANAEEHRIVPKNFHWEPDAFHKAMTKMTAALRPWTIDFHVAQNDGTVKGLGYHDKTGRHCMVTDKNGKLDRNSNDQIISTLRPGTSCTLGFQLKF